MAAQIVAVLIFVIMFALIITEKYERHIVALVSGALTLVVVFGICMHSVGAALEILNIRSIFNGGWV